MKRIAAILIFSMMFSFSTLTAFAQESTQPIQVYVDGDKVELEVAPLLDEGTTLVQFRPILEKLGLKVEWDEQTRTATAAKEGLTVKLQIDNRSAWVNGEEKMLALAPRIVNDVTLVPLRFAGETSGRDVSWDGISKTVFIAAAEKQIAHLVDKNIKYLQEENLEGVMSTIYEGAPYYDQIRDSNVKMFAAFDYKYEIEKMEILELNKDKAKIQMTQVSRKISGPEAPDVRNITEQGVQKIGGEWKFTGGLLIKTDYMNQHLFKEESVTLTVYEQKQVLDVIEANRAAQEKEDFDALRSTLHKDFPHQEEEISMAKQVGVSFDLKMQNDNIKIIQGKENEAKVRYTTMVKKVSGPPQFNNFKVESVASLKKTEDGQWKIISSDMLTMEILP